MTMAKKIDIDKYVSGLFLRTEEYADKVRQHYATAVNELLKLSANSHISPEEIFSFGDNKKLSSKANEILRQLYSAVYNEIKEGVEAEWENANLSCDALIESIFGKGLEEDNHFARWFSRNQEAMDSFFERKSSYGGMNLSQKVWKYTGALKTEMELALSLSLGQGDSASTVSRQVRKYLQEPDRLFRRIRTGTDANGKPLYKLSKAAKAYHPGRGVYRSSYKNAMRLTRTEINMAYKTAEQDRWQRLDFVVGYEIKTSNNHPEHDICDELKGKYPKDFVFKGWHPQCRCYVVPILATDDEFIEIQKKILAGENISNNHYSGEITEVPDKFNKWIEKNKERINKAESLPYFIKDNFVGGDIDKGLKFISSPILSNDNSLVTLFEAKKYWDISIIDNGKYNNGIANKIDWIELHNGINITARKHGINIDDFSVYIDNENVRFFVSGKNFELQRTFKILDSGIIDVHHDLFEIDEIYQGKGISKEIFKILYAQYKKIGVDQISLFANIDIGGYTWARYGFYAKNKFSALRAVRSDNAKKFIEQYYIDNSLSIDAPFPMRLITEHFDGKEELLDKNWNGILNLNDDKARGIFEKYIGW